MVAPPTVATIELLSFERVTIAGFPSTVAPTSPDLTLEMSGDFAAAVVVGAIVVVEVGVIEGPLPTTVVVDETTEPELFD
jgi:hypothetical protein